MPKTTEDTTNTSLTVNTTKNGQPKYKLDKLLCGKNSRSTSTTSTRCTIVALIEGRGSDRGIIGMSCMDLRNSELTICEFFDSRSYTMLRVRLLILDPIEIIVPEVVNDKHNHMKLLLDMVKSTVTGAQISTVQRRYFHDQKGVELVKQLGSTECCNIDTSVVKKYYCMAATAALLKYIEYIQNILFAQGSLRITYEAIDDCCLIDVNSWSNLDLINMEKGNKNVKKNPTLFTILNKCVSATGSKYLRSCLLQPSANSDLIEERQDVVQEFVANPALLDRIRTMLANVSDLSFLINLCISRDKNMLEGREDSTRAIRLKTNQILSLKRMICVVIGMTEILANVRSDWLIKNRFKLQDKRLSQICSIIDEKIDESVLLRKTHGSAGTKDCALFAVRQGLHVLLDLARKTYKELVNDITKVAIDEQEKVPGAQMAYSFARGYYLSLTVKDPLSTKLPPHCINVVRHRASITYTTRALIKYNDRLNQSESEILFKSNIVVDQLIAEIRKLLPVLYHLIEFFTQLDFISALACYSATCNGVRPKLSSDMTVRNSRHPILETVMDVVPNDIYIVPRSRCLIITGPNMAGKSTYMKQVCLIQILAQLGAFVPADYATFSPMQRIFSRVGHNDDISRNLSAFALEMSEMSIILPHASDKSLIVIDELARSTSTEEGMGICYAICELLIKSGAFVLFATHFLDLSHLEFAFPAVQNFHFAVQTKIDDKGLEVLHPSHRIFRGTYKGPLYGFELAELATFPPALITSAKSLAEKLHTQVHMNHLSSMATSTTPSHHLSFIAYQLKEILSFANDDNVSEVSALLLQLRKRVADQTLL